MFCHCFDEHFKPFCHHIDVVICFWVGCFIIDDGFTEHDGVIDLGLGRVYCLED